MAVRKQHDRIQPNDQSDRASTKVRTPEARRAAKQVSTTKPYGTNHDAAGDKSAAGRRADSHKANGHQAGDPVGLASAAAAEGRVTAQRK
jgi:hypothetical protein